MNELRYPLSALLWDYFCSVGGLALFFVILVTNDWQNALVWLFVGLTILFVVYTMLTIAKNLAVFRVSEEGIECGAFRRRRIRWADLSGMSLRFYPTSRSRKKGWMSLILKSAEPEARIEIESTLPGFSEIVARAAHAARENNLNVDRATVDNLTAIGAMG